MSAEYIVIDPSATLTPFYELGTTEATVSTDSGNALADITAKDLFGGIALAGLAVLAIRSCAGKGSSQR